MTAFEPNFLILSATKFALFLCSGDNLTLLFSPFTAEFMYDKIFFCSVGVAGTLISAFKNRKKIEA